MPGHAAIANQAIVQQMLDQGIMVVEVAGIAVEEGNVDTFAHILLIDAKPPLQLHFDEGLAIDVASDEIGTLPVIAQPQAVEAIVGQLRSDLLEIVVFLLTGIEIGIGYAGEHVRELLRSFLGQQQLASKNSPFAAARHLKVSSNCFALFQPRRLVRFGSNNQIE